MGGVNLVVGFRPELWAASVPGAAAPGLEGFNSPVAGADGLTMAPTKTAHD